MVIILQETAIEPSAIWLLDERLDKAFGDVNPSDEAIAIEKTCQKINTLSKILQGAKELFGNITYELVDVITAAPSDIWLPELTHCSLHEYKDRTRVIYELLGKYVSGHSRILDLGCGTCNTLLKVSHFSNHQRLLGLEINADTAFYAHYLLSCLGLNDIELIIGDLFRVPLPQSSCDLITIFNCLKFYTEEQIRSCLTEAMNILQVGGGLLINDTMNLIRQVDLADMIKNIGFSSAETIDISDLTGTGPELILYATR